MENGRTDSISDSFVFEFRKLDRMDDEMRDGFEMAVGEITVALLHRIRRTIMKTKMKI